VLTGLIPSLSPPGVHRRYDKSPHMDAISKSCRTPPTHLCPLGPPCAPHRRYEKPPHVDPADFIQEVPTDSGLEFLRPGMRHLSAAELEAAYKASPYYREVQRVLDASSEPEKVL